MRLRCNNFGDDCYRIGYFERDYNRDDYVAPYGYTRIYHHYYPDTYVAPGYYEDYDNDYVDEFPG